MGDFPMPPPQNAKQKSGLGVARIVREHTRFRIGARVQLARVMATRWFSSLYGGKIGNILGVFW